MNKYLVYYNSKTLASLSKRSEQQRDSHPIWNFVFQNTSVTVNIFDNIEIKNNIKFHAGINLIVEISSGNNKEAEENSKNYVETILNLITLSTQAYCESAQMVGIIDITDISNTQYTGVQKIFTENTMPLGSLRIIDKNDFSAIFTAWDKNQYQERVIRSLSWFRKGINEENTVDEFIALWTGLEVVKGILRKDLKQKIKNPDEWEGLRDIFINKIGINYFESIKDSRNEILHGYREIDHVFIDKIKDYIVPTREALFFSIGKVLSLEDNLVKKLISLGIRRSVDGMWSVIKTHIKNLPSDVFEIISNFPVVRGKVISENFKINGDNISYSPKTTYTFSGPKEALWEVNSMELRGDENSGIEPTFSKPNIEIKKQMHDQLDG